MNLGRNGGACHCDQCDEKENPLQEVVDQLKEDKSGLVAALEAIVDFEKAPNISKWAKLIDIAKELVEAAKEPVHEPK